MSKCNEERIGAYIVCEASPRNSCDEYDILVMAFTEHWIHSTPPGVGAVAYIDGDSQRSVRWLGHEIVFASYADGTDEERYRDRVRKTVMNAAWLPVQTWTDLPTPPFFLFSCASAEHGHRKCKVRLQPANYAEFPDCRAGDAFTRNIPGVPLDVIETFRDIAIRMKPSPGDWFPVELRKGRYAVGGAIRVERHLYDDVFTVDMFLEQVGLIPPGTQLYRRACVANGEAGEAFEMVIATVMED